MVGLKNLILLTKEKSAVIPTTDYVRGNMIFSFQN